MIRSLILDLFTAGLYSQYLQILAPIGFQYPNSISFNDIIDFHDYIIMFLVFIFIIVIWHLFWALNLYNLLFNIVYLHAIINYYYDYIIEMRETFAFVIPKLYMIVYLDFPKYGFVDTNGEVYIRWREYEEAMQFITKKCNAPAFLYLILYQLFKLFDKKKKTHLHFLLFTILFAFLEVMLTVFFLTKKPWPSFAEPKFDQSLLIFFVKNHVRSEKLKTKNMIHAPSLEIFWTIFPSFILLAIAVPSLILLYQLDAVEPLSLCIKVVGHQWYWTYEIGSSIGLFQDHLPGRKVIYQTYFDSYMLANEISHLRLLEVDNPLFVPAGIPLTFLITSTDVIHSWAVPSLGIKVDAIPGRLNQVGVTVLSEGIFYGQCSELCGVNHGFMPINIIAF